MSTNVVVLNPQSQAYQAFLDDMRSRLALLDTESVFEGSQWQLKFSKTLQVDFALYTDDCTQFVDSVPFTFNETVIHLTVSEFAKFLMLSLCDKSEARYRAMRDCLPMLFMLLTENDTEQLNEAQLQEYLAQVMLFDVKNGELIKRLSAASYSSRMRSQLSVLYELKALVYEYKSPLLIPDVSEQKVRKILNDTCLAQMGITLKDYEKGGSFNFLTLDVGRHYVDFCARKFETHWLYASVCHDILNDESLFDGICIADKALSQRGTLSKNSLGTLKSFMAQTLIGLSPDEFSFHQTFFGPERRESVHRLVRAAFIERYKASYELSHAVGSETLGRIAKDCHLGKDRFGVERFDVQEFIRVMQYTRIFNDNTKPRGAIFREYQATQQDNAAFAGMTLRDFDGVCKRHVSTPKLTFKRVTEILKKSHKSLRQVTSISPLKPVSELAGLVSDVQAAGLTTLLAYTGWRKSEFDFPRESLLSAINEDPLDSNYIPLRHYVKWKVKKTSGNTLLQREITCSTALLIHQLSALSTGARMLTGESDTPTVLDVAVYRNWRGFVTLYQPFIDTDRLDALQAKGVLNNDEQAELNTLLECYADNHDTRHLLALKQQLREAQPRLDVFDRQLHNHRHAGVVLKGYVEGQLNASETALLNKYLSENTKTHLKDELNATGELSYSTVQNATREVQEGVVYPSPHAFRHIWAEAVLRRYRGDVGKFIRANFKHIDERFFAAYLRDKETKVVMQVAERQVISDLVRKRIDTLSHGERREYAGKFDRFISKSVSLLKVVGDEADKEKLAHDIGEKIVAMKANAFSSCLLRKGTENQAKCAVNGIAQRHRASPKFCMACINGDITNTNLPGILAFTKLDVDACRDTFLPVAFKQQHVDTVRSALARIEELKHNAQTSKYDKIIAFYRESIEMAKTGAQYD